MNNGMIELQSHVARISAELAEAQRTIRTLEARKKVGRSPVIMWLGVVVTIVALTSWGSHAQTPTNQSAQIADLIKRVTELEKMRVLVSALEESDKNMENAEKKMEQSKNKITAPFDVVDSAGQPILHVSDDVKDGPARGIYLRNLAGKDVIEIVSPDGIGARVTTHSGTNDDRMSIGSVAGDTGFRLRRADTILADLNITEQGGLLSVSANDGASAVLGVPKDRPTMGVRVRNKNGGNAASLSINGDSPTTGVVSIVGADNRVAASMQVVGANIAMVGVLHDGKTVAALGAESDGRGYVSVLFGQDPVAMLTSSDTNPGAGRLTLDAPGGAWAVRAGFSGSHGDVCVGGTGVESRAASHCVWGSAVVGSLAK